MSKLTRLTLASLACGLLALVNLDALAAGRGIRVDSEGLDFSTERGEAWSLVTTFTYAADGTPSRNMPFSMNFSGSAGGGTTYTFVMQPGTVNFLDSQNALAGFITPFFGPTLNIPGGDWGIGIVDPSGPPPYVESDAFEAIRFTWRGTSNGTDLAAQVVLLNRGDGDFDIELNYGSPFDDVQPSFPPGGSANFSLGPSQFTQLVDASSIFNFCFRDGVNVACAAEVPEPTTLAMAGLALALLAGQGIRRRRA